MSYELGVVLRGCFLQRLVEAACIRRVAGFLFTSSFRVLTMSHTRLNSASELKQEAPKATSNGVSEYDVSQAVGKEKERVAQNMSQIKETVGDGARGAVKKLPLQVSKKVGDEPLKKFRMAARNFLHLRQQSKLDLNEHIQK